MSASDRAAEAADRIAPSAGSAAVSALERQLARLFTSAGRRVQDRATQVHPELTPGAYRVLAVLVNSGPQHAGSIAARLYSDKSVISRITKQLEALGMLGRQPDPADGRSCFLAATPDAVAKFRAVSDAHRSMLHEHLAGWDDRDIEQLATLLARLNAIDTDAADTGHTAG